MYALKALIILGLLMGFAFSSETTDANVREVVFGINLALNATLAGGYAGSQYEAFIGFQIWVNWWNSLPASARTSRWGQVIQIRLHIETYSDYAGGGTPTEKAGLFNVYANMAQNPSIDYLIGPIGFAGVELRQYMYDLGVELMVYPADSSERFYAIPGSFGSPTANILTMTPWLPYLRVSKASTLAVVAVNDGVYTTELCKGLVDQAPYNNLEIVLSRLDLPFDWSNLGDVESNVNSTIAWKLVLDQIIEMDPDAVAVCDYGPGAEFALDYFRSKNWIPKSFSTYPLYTEFKDKSLLDYVVVPKQFSPMANLPKQINFTDSAGYNNIVRTQYGVDANAVMAGATLCGMLYTCALIDSPSNSSADMIATMRTQQIQSFMGTSAMDAKGRHTLSTLIAQYLNSGKQINIVGPAQAAVDAFIYPMPKWSERKFNPKWGSGVEIAGTVLAGTGFIVSLMFGIHLFINRNNPIIYAASPVFCGLIIFGSWIVYGSIFVWMPSLVSNTTCFLRAWLLPIGFSIMFGSLFAKTYRIYKLFTDHSLNIIVVKNWRVAFYVSLIVSGQIAISIFMVSIAPIKSILHTIDPYRPSLSYNVCTFSVTAKAFMIVNIVAGAGLLAWGSFLIYNIRKIPNSVYDESKIIAFLIYNTAFFAVIILVIQLVIGNRNRDLTFMITAACCFLGAMIAVCVLFGTKIYAVERDITKSGSTTGSHRSGGSGRNRSSPIASEKHTSSSKTSDGVFDPYFAKSQIDARTAELIEMRKDFRARTQGGINGVSSDDFLNGKGFPSGSKKKHTSNAV
jgi:hypothetical protein